MAPKRNLFSEAEAEDRSKRPRIHRKESKSFDGALTRVLSMNLRGYSDHDIYVREVGGQTLYDVVKKDLEEAQQVGKYLSAGYWGPVRQRFPCSGNEGAVLRAKSGTEKVDQALVEALKRAKGPACTKKGTEKLVLWMETTDALGQRELVGILNYLGDHKPLHELHGSISGPRLHEAHRPLGRLDDVQG